MTLKDRFKKYKRILRFYIIKAVIDSIIRQPVRVLPKIKRLLLKFFSMIFRTELSIASNLLPEEFRSRKAQILKGMAENQVSTLLEVFCYEKLLESNPNYIKIEGLENLEKAYKEHGSFIILSAHFGNWEIIGYTIAKLGYKMNVIARPQAETQMTKLMNSFREKRNIDVIMKNNIKESIRRLRSGEIVGLLSDLNAREWGYQTEFFGKKASFYNVPVILSMRAKSPIIPSFAERQADGTQIIRFEEPIIWTKGESMVDRIRKYVERYERAFRRRPDQWCWFHNRYEHSELGRLD